MNYICLRRLSCKKEKDGFRLRRFNPLAEVFQIQGIDWQQIADETLCELLGDFSEVRNSGDILQWQEISRDRLLQHKAVFHTIIIFYHIRSTA